MADERAVNDVLEQIGLVIKEAIVTHGWSTTAGTLCAVVAKTIHAGEHLGGERHALLGSWLTGMHDQLNHLNALCDAQAEQARRTAQGKVPDA